MVYVLYDITYKNKFNYENFMLLYVKCKNYYAYFLEVKFILKLLLTIIVNRNTEY